MSFQLPSYEELNNVPYSSNGDNNCDDLIIWFNEEAYKNLWNIAASSKKDEVGGLLFGKIYSLTANTTKIIDPRISDKKKKVVYINITQQLKNISKDYFYHGHIKEQIEFTAKQREAGYFITGMWHSHPMLSTKPSSYDKKCAKIFCVNWWTLSVIINPFGTTLDSRPVISIYFGPDMIKKETFLIIDSFTADMLLLNFKVKHLKKNSLKFIINSISTAIKKISK